MFLETFCDVQAPKVASTCEEPAVLTSKPGNRGGRRADSGRRKREIREYQACAGSHTDRASSTRIAVEQILIGPSCETGYWGCYRTTYGCQRYQQVSGQA